MIRLFVRLFPRLSWAIVDAWLTENDLVLTKNEQELDAGAV